MEGLLKRLTIGHRKSASTTVPHGSNHQTGDSQSSSESASPLTPRTVNHDRNGSFTTEILKNQQQAPSDAQKEVVKGRPVTSERGPNNLVNLPRSLAGVVTISNSIPKESSGENSTLDKLSSYTAYPMYVYIRD